jgi:tRNA(adenine34) deaminase
MKLAVEAAGYSGQDIPVGAILVRGSELLGKGCNTRETSSDPTGHAEIVALRQAAEKLGTWRLAGSTIYTTLEPCPMCAEAIIQARVARVIFGAYDNVSGACGSAFNLFTPGRNLPIPELVGGIMEEQCQQLLVDFFRNLPQR